MNLPAALPTPMLPAHPPAATDLRLAGRGLVLARVIWITVTLVALVIFVLSIPAYFGVLRTICTGTAASCINIYNQLTSDEAQRFASQHLSLDTYAASILALDLAASLVFLAVGGLIFWRRSDERMALFVSLVLIIYGALGPSGNVRSGTLSLAFPAASPVPLLVNILGNVFWPAFGVFFYLFPTGRFVPRWSWVFVIAWVIQLVVYEVPMDSLLYIGNLPLLLVLAVMLSTYGMALGCQIYRYVRVSSSVQRQQTKWLLFGFASSLLLTLFTRILSGVAFPQEESTPDALYLLGGVVIVYVWLLPIPLAIGIAVLRYRLWDIDAIINRALVYGLLTALLGALYAGLIIGLGSLGGVIAGPSAQQPVVLVVSTLAIAALFLPLRRRIQSLIDRRFYRRKYDAEKTLAGFSATLRNEVDLEQVRGQVLAVVNETMQPAHVSLWLRAPERQAPPEAWRSTGALAGTISQWPPTATGAEDHQSSAAGDHL